MAKNRIIYLVSLIAVVIFYIDYDGWISSYALILLILMPILSLLLCLPSLVDLKLNMSVKKVCRRNEKNDIGFWIKRGWFGYSPLCKLNVTTNDLLGEEKVKYEVTVAKGIMSPVPLNTEHCGVYECTVTKAYAYDFLCLFRFKVKVPKEFTVTVAPTPVCPIPEPVMNGFAARSLKPKAGGGFSEIHETREYRPGDPMNSVHWKLSAKTDELIIREAMVPERMLVIVSLDLTNDRAKYDKILDRLRWVSSELLSRDVIHSVCYLDTDDGTLCSVTVSSDEELWALLIELLSRPIRVERESLASRSFNEADWRYHILVTGGDAE